MMQKLLLATNNQGKINEYRQLLAGVPFQIVSLTDEGITTVVEETGNSFRENAGLKAVAILAESGLITLADDSGLEVDALGGEPGVMSARYAGENASDSERINYLLANMEKVPREERTARFRCVIAIALPGGDIEFCSGDCSGYIAFKPEGENGFGYDPVFYLPELDKTMAEISGELKNRISHRARAAAGASGLLKKMAENLAKTG